MRSVLCAPSSPIARDNLISEKLDWLPPGSHTWLLCGFGPGDGGEVSRQFVFVSVFVFVSLSAAWLLDRGRGSRCQNNRLAFDWHPRESPAPSARDWFQATKHFLLSWPIITCGQSYLQVFIYNLTYKYLFTILLKYFDTEFSVPAIFTKLPHTASHHRL